MDKLTIVMSNYINVECDANTTPRQAYERGFRRAAEKYETVMRSRKAKNDALESENAKLKAQIEALKEYAHALELCRNKAYLCEYCTFNGIDFDHDDINCAIDFDGLQKKAGCRKKIKEITNNG